MLFKHKLYFKKYNVTVFSLILLSLVVYRSNFPLNFRFHDVSVQNSLLKKNQWANLY